MNGRTSKMLRRWAVKKGFSVDSAKRGWYRTPRNQRAKLRRELFDGLGQAIT